MVLFMLCEIQFTLKTKEPLSNKYKEYIDNHIETSNTMCNLFDIFSILKNNLDIDKFVNIIRKNSNNSLLFYKNKPFTDKEFIKHFKSTNITKKKLRLLIKQYFLYNLPK
jgi:hypothetical protein